MHLDFDLNIVPVGMRGVLPEIWGEAPTSWETSALLESPGTRATQELVEVAQARRLERPSSSPHLWARPQLEPSRVHLCVLSDR